jgi:hypothetical protein
MVKGNTRVFLVLRNELVLISMNLYFIFSDLEDGAGFQLF